MDILNGTDRQIRSQVYNISLIYISESEIEELRLNKTYTLVDAFQTVTLYLKG